MGMQGYLSVNLPSLPVVSMLISTFGLCNWMSCYK